MRKLVECAGIILLAASSAQAGLVSAGNSTNNVTDFYTGTTNATAGGRWSYAYNNWSSISTASLSYRRPATGTDANGMVQWDANYPDGYYLARSDGYIYSDWRPTAAVYTVDTTDVSVVNISGNWKPAVKDSTTGETFAVDWAGVRVNVWVVRDGNASVIDVGAGNSNVEVLWEDKWGNGTAAENIWGRDALNFNLTNVNVNPGDDIVFQMYWTNISGDGENRGWWWESRAMLDGTISAVPEPGCLSLMLVGAFGLARRMQRR